MIVEDRDPGSEEEPRMGRSNWGNLLGWRCKGTRVSVGLGPL